MLRDFTSVDTPIKIMAYRDGGRITTPFGRDGLFHQGRLALEMIIYDTGAGFLETNCHHTV